MSECTDLEWHMAGECLKEMRSHPTWDHRVVIMDWMRRARDAAANEQMAGAGDGQLPASEEGK